MKKYTDDIIKIREAFCFFCGRNIPVTDFGGAEVEDGKQITYSRCGKTYKVKIIGD
jgi:hypothetical protein